MSLAYPFYLHVFAILPIPLVHLILRNNDTRRSSSIFIPDEHDADD